MSKKDIQDRIILIKENLSFWKEELFIAEKELEAVILSEKTKEFNKMLDLHDYSNLFLYKDMDLLSKKQFLLGITERSSNEIFVVGENKETSQIVFGLSLGRDKKGEYKNRTLMPELISIIRGTKPSFYSDRIGPSKNFLIFEKNNYKEHSFVLCVQDRESFIFKNNKSKAVFKGSLIDCISKIRSKWNKDFE